MSYENARTARRATLAAVASAEHEGGGRRSVDTPINMVPFIDLLLVTISFLLITAVWSSLGRLETSAQLPDVGGTRPTMHAKEPTILSIDVAATEGTARLAWQHGDHRVDIATVALQVDAAGHYADLTRAIEKAYVAGLATEGIYGDDIDFRAADDGVHGVATANAALLHVPNGLAFRDLVKVVDAVESPRRRVCFEPSPRCCARGGGCATTPSDVPAFNVSLSAR